MARKRIEMPREPGCLAADEPLEVISALQAMAVEALAGPKDRAGPLPEVRMQGFRQARPRQETRGRRRGRGGATPRMRAIGLF